jgi:hypothetical protein
MIGKEEGGKSSIEDSDLPFILFPHPSSLRGQARWRKG